MGKMKSSNMIVVIINKTNGRCANGENTAIYVCVRVKCKEKKRATDVE